MNPMRNNNDMHALDMFPSDPIGGTVSGQEGTGEPVGANLRNCTKITNCINSRVPNLRNCTKITKKTISEQLFQATEHFPQYSREN